jgi:lysyl-tRNA synthetase class 2
VNSTNGSSDFLPSATWDRLRLRADLLARTRAFFAERGFLEVETPVLSADTVIDRHLDPIAVTLPDDPRRPDIGRTLYLQTSPEFAMKRLLAAAALDRSGAAPEAIYQLTRAFRAGESGPLHNPEFTMLEWYRCGDDMQAGMTFLSDFVAQLLQRGQAELVRYAEAFWVNVGLDPHAATAEELAAATRYWGISVPDDWHATDGRGADRDAWLNVLLTHLVEPQLGQSVPTILYDYPASQAALARLHGDPPVAARFELYVDGIELANGYYELLDSAVLRERNIAANRERAADGKPTLPDESRLLASMDAGLPDCTGVALGFDRLVMLAAGASTLQEILAFPIDRA